MPDGSRTAAIRPKAIDAGWVEEEEPTPNEATIRSHLRYAAYAVLATALSVSAYETSGIGSTVLAVLAGVVAAVTVWSVVIVGGLMLVVRHFRR